MTTNSPAHKMLELNLSILGFCFLMSVRLLAIFWFYFEKVGIPHVSVHRGCKQDVQLCATHNIRTMHLAHFELHL